MTGVAGLPPDLWSLVLAAGGSRRLGTPKQLLRIRGERLLSRTINAAEAVTPGRVVVVVGAEALKLRLLIRRRHPRTHTVDNSRWADGMAGSLRVGLAVLPQGAVAALVLLSDQPEVCEASLRRLIQAWRRRPGKAAAAAYGDVVGVPAILPRALWREARQLRGDAGAPRVATHGADGRDGGGHARGGMGYRQPGGPGATEAGPSSAKRALAAEIAWKLWRLTPPRYTGGRTWPVSGRIRNERGQGNTVRSTTRCASTLLALGAAMAGFAQDSDISDLCAVASVDSAQAIESGTLPASVVACPGGQPSVTTTARIGDLNHAVGQVGGERLIAVTTDFGAVANTTGQVGGGNVTATTTQFGNTSVTTGQVDGLPIAVTTIEIGNVTYTTGQVGGQPASSSTIKIGDVTYTTGQSGQ